MIFLRKSAILKKRNGVIVSGAKKSGGLGMNNYLSNENEYKDVQGEMINSSQGRSPAELTFIKEIHSDENTCRGDRSGSN